MSRCSGGCNHDHSGDVKSGEWDGGDSLFKSIDIDNVRCLNEREPGMAKHIFKPWDRRRDESLGVLQSDEDDAEMILIIPFINQVQLRSFVLIGGPEGTCPASVKMWKNKEDFDFDEAEEVPALQAFSIADDSYRDIEYPLKAASFLNCSSLVLYFPEAHSASFSQIDFLALRGTSSDHKRQAVTAVYEARPLPGDKRTIKTDSHMPSFY